MDVQTTTKRGNTMTTIKQGETVSRETYITGDLCKVHRLTTHKTEGKLICKWDFDFTDVSKNELIKLAVRSLIIDQQRDIRAAKAKDTTPLCIGDINVREKLDNMRRGKTTLEKAESLMSSLSSEDIKALIEKHTEA